MNFEQQNEKYLNDPFFHAVVDMLHKFLCEGKMTDSELRGAATFAEIMFNQSVRDPWVDSIVCVDVHSDGEGVTFYRKPEGNNEEEKTNRNSRGGD